MSLTSGCFRLRIPALCDVVISADPEQIRWLVAHPLLARPVDPDTGLLQRLLHGRLSGDMSFDGGLLPVFLPRSDRRRAARQAQLAAELDARDVAQGPEFEDMVQFISGQRERDIGPSVQQWCGRLLAPRYRASDGSYEAGRLLAEWPASSPLAAWAARTRGRLAQAKQHLSAAAGGDLHVLHATTIGMENVARTLRAMRRAAQHPELQNSSADRVLQLCLGAPPVLVRGVRGEVEVPFLRRPLTRRTLVVLLVARAHAHSGDADDAFLTGSWSGCPARGAVLKMLRAAWRVARQHEVADGEVSRRPVANAVAHAVSRFEGRA